MRKLPTLRRRFGKLPAFALPAVFMVLAPPFLWSGGSVDPSNQGQFFRELQARPRLVIDLISAECSVETAMGERIRILAVHSYGEDGYQVDIRESRSEIILQERFLRRSSRGTAVWQVTVPATTELRLTSASGDFESRGGFAALEARSATGAISVRDLNGRIDITTASGSVRLRDLSGQLSIDTASGEVELEGFDGRLSLRSAAGDLVMEALSAEIEARSGSGRIEVSGLRASGECSFNSASGDVEVRMAERPAFDLTLTSTSGTAELDLDGNPLFGTFVFSALQHAGRIDSPVEFDERETFAHAGQNYLRATFSRGSGLPTITLATASGSVRLKR